ncbi:MAG TPA: hypothetical protein VMQ61_01515 [Thermoanaerobaculia bacterium]|nr:hypothetical protein [Thermoanaerobaculia bacterium]
MKRSATLALRCLGIGLGILLTRFSAFSGGLPDLSGTWKLNTAQSDDPQQKFKEGASSSGGGSSDSTDSAPPSGGGGGGYGGWGGHHGGHGGGHRHGGGGGDSNQGPSAMEGREMLVIKHADPQLTITDASGRERVLYTDGRKLEEERSYGGTTKVQTVWKDGHVEVTSQSEKGPKIIQSYAVSADGSQLNVTTQIDGRRKVTIHTVYDAVHEPPPTPAPEPPGDVEVTPAK